MTGKNKVAVAQLSPCADKDSMMKKVDGVCAEAGANGARLVLFPEALIGGYPRGQSFGAVVGERLPEGREAYRQYWESAIDVPGPECQALGRLAQRDSLHLVVGVIERDGGTLYCTVLFFSPDGDLLGKHRKLMPTGSERLVWGYGDGSTMPVFDTPVGKVGAVICWENYMPLMRMAHYSKGIEIYCAPTADGRETWLSTMRHIAMEGRCFVLSCNHFARRKHYPAMAGDDPEEIVSRGGSCIIGPLGNVLAGPDFSGECILYADIDLADIVRGKYDFDVVGHYARPDVFKLTVDARPKPPATVFELEHECDNLGAQGADRP